MNRINSRPIRLSSIGVCIGLCFIFQWFLPTPARTDFHVFYQASSFMRSGVNPYQTSAFYSPLYVLVYFMPLTLLPEPLALRVNALVCTLALWFAFWRFSSRNPIIASIGLLSAYAVGSILEGNNDWMPLIAGVVNPIAGIWLAMAKPQMGLVLAVVLMARNWRSKSLWLSVGAVGLIYALSFRMGLHSQAAIDQYWNRAVFPMMLPLGLLAAYLAVSNRDRALSLTAAPLLSPYVGYQSWLAILPLLSRYVPIYLITIVLSWLII